ncbi:MAG TPA: rhodanese [Chromatiales bacterium]|nr:rhodanese [Chromatiales bacterium]
MKVYLVGGAVRDKLLGLAVKERDWVVVGATTEEMIAAGYIPVDAAFPVFLHPETGEEYALARTETKVGAGYKGFEVDAGPQVTLEQDLQRRDLTINAMAEEPETGRIIDPFGGREDLDDGLLRHITPAFVEDPVRLLRIARFAAQLGRWGFRVAHGTFGLLKRMAASDDLLTLRPERIWREMRKSLEADQPWRFFDTLYRCGALSRLIPEFDLPEPGGHRGRQLEAPFLALQRAAEAGDDLPVRFAVVMLAAARRADDVRDFCHRLRAEHACCDLLTLLAAVEGPLRDGAVLDASALLELLERTHAFQHPARFQALLNAAAALWPDSAAEVRDRLVRARQVASAIDGSVLVAEGLCGPEVGRILHERREAVIREVLGDA